MHVRDRVLSVVLFTLHVLAVDVSSARAQANGIIRGRIAAEADGSPVARAAVALQRRDDGRTVQGVADDNGRFAFQDVRAGEYVVTASAGGFSPREVRVLLEPREVRSLDLPLAVGPVAERVDVTADGALIGTHSPSSTVLTTERLERIAPAQRHGLPDAIVTLAPGMIRGHDDFVHIRGHEIALNPLINGVSFWENPHALLSSGLSANVIDTANVMTGGFSAEYGNRFGGVVDIVTKSGFTMRERGTVTASAGEAARRSLALELGGAREGFGYYVFGSVFGSDRFLSPPDAEAIHDSGRGGHAFVRLDGAAGGGALRALFMGDGANFQIPRAAADAMLRPLAQSAQRTRQQTAILSWSRASSSTLWSGTFYQRWSKSRLLPADGPLTARASFERRLLTVGGKGDVSHTTGRHALKAGIDLVRLAPREDLAYDYAGYRELTHVLGLPHIHLAGDTIAFGGRATGGQVSGHVQDAIQLGPRVTADVGARVDRYGLAVSATHVSPRVNVAIEAARGSVLHASFNRFFVPPPIEGILSSSAGLTQGIREIGAALPALPPTVEDQVELGITVPARGVQVAATGYFRASDDPVHTTVWPDSRIYTYAAFDRARAYGLELRVDAPALTRYGLTTYGNYALGRVDFYNPVAGGFVTEAAHLDDTSRFPGPMDQTHTLTAGAAYDHARTGLWIGAAADYGSGTPIGHGGAAHDHADGEGDHAHAAPARAPSRVPSHVTADLSLGVNLRRDASRRPRLVLRIDVENIGNQVYRIAQDGEFSPSQFSIPRLVSFTAKLRF